MQIQRIEFENFRSFGPHLGIDIDPKLTIFVGKNNSGKSNLIKFLTEMKHHHLPLNRTHILEKGNWFNNEAGVDRPLKFKIIAKMTDFEYADLCKKLFIQMFLTPKGSQEEKNVLTNDLLKNITDYYNANKFVFERWLAKKEMNFRFEFIRISDTQQETNYSFEFNDVIIVSTHDGRNFVQTLRQDLPSKKYRERELWDTHLTQIYDDSCVSNKRSNRNGNVPNSLILDEFFKGIFENPMKYVLTSSVIQEYYELLLDHFILASEVVIIEPFLENLPPNRVEEKLQTILIEKLTALQEMALHELSTKNENFNFLSEITPENLRSNAWGMYSELQKRFEDFFDSLDITFALEKTSSGRNIRYYQRSTNLPLYNFESVGTGITERLYFLYQLIVNTGHLFIIDQPEHHLHPHLQRLLYNLIKEYSQAHSIVVITHSLLMFQPDDVLNLRIFTLQDGVSRVNKLDLGPGSYEAFQLRKNFTVRNRDAIFADGIVFVEGVSEEMTFPYFFRSFGLDLDLNSLSLINIGGKGSFLIFLKFAKQLQKEYWFFFDNDVLGYKAGENVTPNTFRASIIYKVRSNFPEEISRLCDDLASYSDQETVEFEGKLELLRSRLQDQHIFIFKSDFEEVFELYLADKVVFRGSKVEKAMQLEQYLKDNEGLQLLPDELYEYIHLIEEELKKV